MRTTLKLLSLVMCWLLCGCAAEAPEGEGAGARPPALLPEAKALGVSEQAVCEDCLCPRGSRCGANGTCYGYVVFGPIPAPPMSPACLCDRQCQEGWTLPAQAGRGAARCDLSFGSYGYCVNPTCELSWSSGDVAPGDTVTLTVTSGNLPSGSYLRLYGTRNGIVDVSGQLFPQVAGSFPITNSAGMAGSYVRYVRIYSPDGAQLCESAAAAVLFRSDF